MNHWYQRREQAMTQLFHKDLRSVGHGAEISVTDRGPPITLSTRMTSRTTWFAYKYGLGKPRRRRNASKMDSEPRGGPCANGRPHHRFLVRDRRSGRATQEMQRHRYAKSPTTEDITGAKLSSELKRRMIKASPTPPQPVSPPPSRTESLQSHLHPQAMGNFLLSKDIPRARGVFSSFIPFSIIA
ncbi:uncharacterized protein LOC134779605 isoform X2 [Penaeus indicus]|uniref:uncharacterized protein LOC134779605 isoform X2 n=1 Tax=Penaeus indicus TaxID=29960 RepID=UPI00300C8DD9